MNFIWYYWIVKKLPFPVYTVQTFYTVLLYSGLFFSYSYQTKANFMLKELLTLESEIVMVVVETSLACF